MTSDLERERERRDGMWSALTASHDPAAVSSSVVASLGLRPMRASHGIFRDHDRTRSLAPPDGVTLTLLDVGNTYEDAFDDDAGEYHYPTTRRPPSRDRAEIEATKNAARLHLPVFVVLRSEAAPGLKQVRRGWVSSWDDARRVFLVTFDAEPSVQAPTVETPFALRQRRAEQRLVPSRPRPGQARFRFEVMRRYGSVCAACELTLDLLLEATHLYPVADGGSDDPRNGLVLCRNHHRAFDAHLFAFDPVGCELRVRADGPSAASLGITSPRLAAVARPHTEALQWRWHCFETVSREPFSGDTGPRA